MRPSPAVCWQDVSVTIGGRRILDSVDVTVPIGGWTAVLGPNGAGKTTLLGTLVGAIEHVGSITVGGVDARDGTPKERARRLAYVPQHPVIPQGVSVFHYVLLGRSPHQGLRFSASAEDPGACQPSVRRPRAAPS